MSNTYRIAAISILGAGLVLHPATIRFARAQTTSPASTLVPSPTATATLLSTAHYWHIHGQLAFAMQNLTRILAYAPNNPDALADAAEVAFESGDFNEATRYRGLLQRAAPTDPRNQKLLAQREPTPEETAILNDARALARDNKPDQAVARYRQLLRGAAPTSLLVEYYLVLGSTANGFDEASNGLGKISQQTPDDPRLQLAYARVLTLNEATRSDGIGRLSDLATNPDVGKTARDYWREVLLWQGASEKSRTQLETYLKTNPSDPQIEAKRQEFIAALPDDGAKAMMRGYNAMAAEDIATATREFTIALGVNPNNPEAMAMMAAIRRKQGRPIEAQMFINHAIRLAPDRRDDLIKAAGGDYGRPNPKGIAEQGELARLAAAGQYDDATWLLSQLIAGQEDASSLVQLGGLQYRAGHLTDAEASFRRAASMDPDNGDAAYGLANILAETGRAGEAASVLTEAEALYTRARNNTGLQRVAAKQRALLRVQTATATGPIGISARSADVPKIPVRQIVPVTNDPRRGDKSPPHRLAAGQVP
jgi:tetratricopeptide (TPR) repeat protein